MKRAVLTLFLCIGLVWLAHASALATTEFCPATIQLRAVGNVSPSSPAQVYGFELDATGQRTVTAQVAFDTDQGWYTADVPSVQLTAKDRTYAGDSIEYQHRDWASPMMYFQFPQDVVIRHAWVHTAQSQGDNFGWQSEGIVECLPPEIDLSALVKRYDGNSTMVHSKELDLLAKAPGPRSTIVAPKSSPPLEHANCAQPFHSASVVEEARPDYPDIARVNGVGRRTVVVTVAIPADGPPSDFWISGPSVSDALNAAALASARLSTYRNAIAYCQAVPSFYYFGITFDPRP